MFLWLSYFAIICQRFGRFGFKQVPLFFLFRPKVFMRHFLLSPVCQSTTSSGEGPEYRPFHDLRFVPEASRPSEHVENHRRAYTQVLFLRKAELGFFTL